MGRDGTSLTYAGVEYRSHEGKWIDEDGQVASLGTSRELDAATQNKMQRVDDAIIAANHSQAPARSMMYDAGPSPDAAKQSWGDKPDQFSDRVKAAHPLHNKDEDRHARYALAMEMIHSRHSKYSLVDLVNWLLTKWPELQQEAKR